MLSFVTAVLSLPQCWVGCQEAKWSRKCEGALCCPCPVERLQLGAILSNTSVAAALSVEGYDLYPFELAVTARKFRSVYYWGIGKADVDGIAKDR